MRIKNIEGLKAKIRPYLQTYLEEMGTVFDDSHFTCPNRSVHKHDDNEASAAFFPTTESWKCFACEEFGDIFTAAHFLEGKPVEGLEFITENILYLAKKYDVPYEVMEKSVVEKEKDKLYEVLNVANKMLKMAIKSNSPKVKPAKDYIKERDWEDIVDEFELGFCVYDKLIENLRSKGFEDKTLKAAGLLANSERSNCKKLFDNRLVFPIRNHYGRIVAFASRKIDKGEGKKYLNFGDTTLYSKSRLFYNLNNGRAYSSVYIVEGYADVFTMQKHGIKNVIALCGLGFSKKQYRLLVSQGIKKVIFCLDSDEAGIQATTRIVDKELKNKTDLDCYIKELPKDFKDIDDLLKEKGREEFDKIPEYPIFDWKLRKLNIDNQDEFLKNDLINLIVLTQDYTEKELLIKKLADKLEIDFNAVRKEVERNEKYGDNAYLITSGDILQEQNSFEKRLNDWERIAWTRTGKLLGLPIPNFPILTQKIDGMQHALYLIAADTNIGKTCFLLNLAEGILQSNEKAFVLLFSIDDNINQIIPRMAALKSEIEINTIGNPKFKIEKNEDLTDTEINTLLRKREGTINKLKELSSRFAIKQQSDVKNIEEMEKYIKIYRTIAADKQLIVMVDNLHRIKVRKKLNSVREQFMYISSVLKDWKDNYQVPVIATAELKKFGEIRKPRGDDIKEAKELQYDADMTALLYTDFYNEIGKVKLEHSDGQGYFKPVIEFRVIKNKTSSFKGNLYYKFFPEYSKLVECTQEEMKNFRHPERNK